MLVNVNLRSVGLFFYSGMCNLIIDFLFSGVFILVLFFEVEVKGEYRGGKGLGLEGRFLGSFLDRDELRRECIFESFVLI